jgi:hypothetical protein
MKLNVVSWAPAILAALLCACAATSLKQTWKSPDFSGGPVRTVAVLAVEERGLVRQGIENRFARQLQTQGQPAVVTYDILSLQQIKNDKQAAAARAREAGADSVLIVRLVDVATYASQVRALNERYAPVTTGMDTYGWYNYYSLALMDMSPTYGTLRQKVYLDTTLFDLETGKRLWSGLTETTVKENTDRVLLVDALVGKVAAAMRKDSVVR